MSGGFDRYRKVIIISETQFLQAESAAKIVSRTIPLFAEGKYLFP